MLAPSLAARGGGILSAAGELGVFLSGRLPGGNPPPGTATLAAGVGRFLRATRLDGDGRADLRAVFEVPRDPSAGLRVDVTPLTGHVRPMMGVGRESLSSLIARVGDAIVVRVPLRIE